jgi:tight adherence protein C
MVEWFAQVLEGDQVGLMISIFVFAAAVAIFLAFAFVLIPVLQTQKRLDLELVSHGFGGRQSLEAQAEIRKMAARAPVDSYFTAMEREQGQKNAIEKRLFEAGFYGRGAIIAYNLVRVGVVVAAFLGLFTLLSAVIGSLVPLPVILGVSLILAGGLIVVPSIALDFYAKSVKEQYRRGFPDFMDMMITCADAGMSLEAAVERVANEFAATHKHLGIQLSILSLQLRAGKPLRDGLREMSERIGLEEAKSLAVLFRQSEELGTSLVDALRVYGAEMRTQRVLRAEEKANSLPVRMVIPLGLCVFPVVMMIVMLPVFIRMRGVFF